MDSIWLKARMDIKSRRRWLQGRSEISHCTRTGRKTKPKFSFILQHWPSLNAQFSSAPATNMIPWISKVFFQSRCKILGMHAYRGIHGWFPKEFPVFCEPYGHRTTWNEPIDAGKHSWGQPFRAFRWATISLYRGLGWETFGSSSPTVCRNLHEVRTHRCRHANQGPYSRVCPSINFMIYSLIFALQRQSFFIPPTTDNVMQIEAREDSEWATQ